MASSFTPNLGLELQGTGDSPGTWGSVLNLAALTIVDNAMGGVQTLSLSSSNVVVNTAQSQNNAFKLTGTLSADVDVTFPAIGRTYFVANNTTGPHTVTLKCAGGGTSVVIQQGRNGFIVLDGVNVIGESSNEASPTGAVVAFANTAVPAGWLYCNGQAVLRNSYPALFAAIGTTYGAGDGTTTFNLPDMRAYVIRGQDDGRGIDTGRAMGSSQDDALQEHTHTYDKVTNWPTDGVSINNQTYRVVTLVLSAVQTAISGTIGRFNANETRVKNVAMRYCIKT